MSVDGLEHRDETERVGRRIRETRKQQSITLKVLSERTNLSTPHLSQIENGRVNVNVTNLHTIGRALGVPVVTFFQDGEAPTVSITRRADRRWFDHGDGTLESYVIKTKGSLEIFTIRLPGGTNTGEATAHTGEECTYITRGSVTLTLEGYDTYDLGEGDVVYYASDVPHRWANTSNEEAEVLVVNTPATY